MILVMAVDSKWAIGYKGDMLTRIPEDLKRFKEITTGGVLLMGRKTYDATGALPDRETGIISRSMAEEDGVHIVRDIDKLDDYFKKNFPDKKIFLVGGASIIDQLIDHVDRAEITYIKKDFKNYDTAMLNLDEDDAFIVTEKSEEHVYEGMIYEYRTYTRK